MTQLLRDILQEDKKFRGLNAILLWADVVESKIQKHTLALKIQNSVLYVLCESAVWAQELGFFKQEIIGKINDKAGFKAIKEIRFKVGEIKE